MTFYALILFVHVVAVLALFAALSFEVLSMLRLRQASNLTEAHLWIEPVRGLPLVTIGSVLVIFISGIYLAIRMSAFDLAWPKVTVAALLLIAPLGAMTGRRMRALRQACATTKAFNPELLKQLRDPFLKISLSVRIAVALGIVLLMVAKPGWSESLSIVGASVLLGFLSALFISRARTSLSTPGTHVHG